MPKRRGFMMSGLSGEEFEDMIKEHERLQAESKIWLISRGWDESEVERLEKGWTEWKPKGEKTEIDSFQKAVSKEYENLLKELGWYEISSINVVNVIPQFKRGTDIRTGRYKFYRSKMRRYSVPTARFYNPHKKYFMAMALLIILLDTMEKIILEKT